MWKSVIWLKILIPLNLLTRSGNPKITPEYIKINVINVTTITINKFLILKNFSRQALHAYHLGFFHPLSNNYIEFESELPEDMKNLLDLLVKY